MLSTGASSEKGQIYLFRLTDWQEGDIELALQIIMRTRTRPSKPTLASLFSVCKINISQLDSTEGLTEGTKEMKTMIKSRESPYTPFSVSPPDRGQKQLKREILKLNSESPKYTHGKSTLLSCLN
jgi:hypothetical protein